MPEHSSYRLNGESHECNCEWQLTLRRHYLLANIPQNYWTLSFDDYYGDPGAWDAASVYLDHWEGYREQGIGIEFYSEGMGVGKTFLATYIARQLVQLSESVYYLRFLEIMGLYQKPWEIREPIETRLRESPVLVLDEVGRAISEEQNSYFAIEFESLIRSRTDSNRVTIMTTNLTPDQLDREYPRTYSLLAAKQKRHEIHGDDVRREGVVQMRGEELAINSEVRPIS